MCTCVVSGAVMRWRTGRIGVFDGPGVTFFGTDQLGSNDAEMGFTVILTNNSMGQLTSIMTYTPTAVSTTGLTVICEDLSGTANMTFLAGHINTGTHSHNHTHTHTHTHNNYSVRSMRKGLCDWSCLHVLM